VDELGLGSTSVSIAFNPSPVLLTILLVAIKARSAFCVIFLAKL
jgi:hypothetical protein